MLQQCEYVYENIFFIAEVVFLFAVHEEKEWFHYKLSFLQLEYQNWQTLVVETDYTKCFCSIIKMPSSAY